MWLRIPLWHFFAGEMGIVAGWGRLSEGGQLPNILQYVSKMSIKGNYSGRIPWLG